jgi:excisionase family DNA binding protein
MQKVSEPRPRLLTVTEVAAQLGVRPAFVYDLARRHLLPVIRVGRYCRFDPAALSRWLEAGGIADGALDGSDQIPQPVDGRQPRR